MTTPSTQDEYRQACEDHTFAYLQLLDARERRDPKDEEDARLAHSTALKKARGLKAQLDAEEPYKGKTWPADALQFLGETFREDTDDGVIWHILVRCNTGKFLCVESFGGYGYFTEDDIRAGSRVGPSAHKALMQAYATVVAAAQPIRAACVGDALSYHGPIFDAALSSLQRAQERYAEQSRTFNL